MLIDLQQTTAGTADQVGNGNLARTFSGALVSRATALAQSVTNLAAPVSVIWSDEAYDSAGWWAPGDPTELVVPAGVTRVRMTGSIRVDGGVSGDLITMQLAINGTVAPSLTGARYRSNGNVPQAWPVPTYTFAVTPTDVLELKIGLIASVTASISLPATSDVTAMGIEAVAC